MVSTYAACIRKPLQQIPQGKETERRLAIKNPQT